MYVLNLEPLMAIGLSCRRTLHWQALALRSVSASAIGFDRTASTESNLGWRRAPQVEPPSYAVFIFGSVEDIT
jgi:hypothetical protein